MSAADFVRNPDKKPIIFTIGRMNPPTSGHLKLIQTLMEKALELGEEKIYIILSHTQDNKKNPLYCSRKRELLTTKGMIEKIKRENPDLEHIEVKIRCMDDPVDETCGSNPILKQICQIRKDEGDAEQMLLVIGEDRSTSYNWIRESLSKLDPPVSLIIEPLDRPDGAMSATYMRGLIISGNEEKFVEESMKNGLSEESALILYKDLTNVLGSPELGSHEFDERQNDKKKGTNRPAPSDFNKPPRKKTKKGGKRKTRKRKTHKRKTHKRKK
jgi:nicotinamide mononucleotide adenylyltransferase